MYPVKFDLSMQNPCYLDHKGGALLYSCKEPKFLISRLEDILESGEDDFFKCRERGVEQTKSYILGPKGEGEIHVSCSSRVKHFDFSEGNISHVKYKEFTRRLVASYLRRIGEGCVDKMDVQFEDDIIYAIAIRKMQGDDFPRAHLPEEIAEMATRHFKTGDLDFAPKLNYGQVKKIVKEICEDVSVVSNFNIVFNKERRKYLLENILEFRKLAKEIKPKSLDSGLSYFVSYGLKVFAGSHDLYAFEDGYICNSYGFYLKGDQTRIYRNSFDVPKREYEDYEFAEMAIIKAGMCNPEYSEAMNLTSFAF